MFKRNLQHSNGPLFIYNNCLISMGDIGRLVASDLPGTLPFVRTFDHAHSSENSLVNLPPTSDFKRLPFGGGGKCVSADLSFNSNIETVHISRYQDWTRVLA